MRTAKNPTRIGRGVSPRRRASQRGNALIEFALSAVILMLLTIGVTDFSRLFAIADVAASAAAAGAQYGALSPAHWSDFAGMQEAALDDAGSTLTGVTVTPSNTCYCSVGGIATTCPASCGGGSQMEYITVSVTVPSTSYFSYPWMPSISSLTSVDSVRVQ